MTERPPRPTMAEVSDRPRHPGLHRARRAPARGFAVVLALVAVATATLLGAALASTRDDSVAVGDTLVRASAARAAAAGGLDLSMALLADPSALGADVSDGKTRILFDEVRIGSSTFHAEVLDLRTGLPATADSEAVAVISRVDLGDIRQSARAVGRLIRPDRRHRADLDLSEFAVFTAHGSSDALRVHDNSRIATWSSSPYAVLREPVFVGDLSRDPAVESDGGSVLQGWVRVRAGSPPRSKEERDAEIAAGERSVPAPIHIPAAPTPARPVYPSPLPEVPVGSIASDILYGAALALGGPLTIGSSVSEGVLLDVDGDLAISGEVRILGPTAIIVRGNLTTSPGTVIEIEGDATLAIIVFGTTDFRATYIGDQRDAALDWPPADGTADYGRGASCFQLFAAGSSMIRLEGEPSPGRRTVLIGEIYAPANGVTMQYGALYGRVLGQRVRLNEASIFYDPALNSGRGWLNPDSAVWTSGDAVRGGLPELLLRFESRCFADLVEALGIDADLPPLFTVIGANAAKADEDNRLAHRLAIEARRNLVRNTHLGGGYAAFVVSDPKAIFDEFTGKEHLRPE